MVANEFGKHRCSADAGLEYGGRVITSSIEACIITGQSMRSASCKYAWNARSLAPSDRLHVCSYGCGGIDPQDVCWAQSHDCSQHPCKGSAAW